MNDFERLEGEFRALGKILTRHGKTSDEIMVGVIAQKLAEVCDLLKRYSEEKK